MCKVTVVIPNYNGIRFLRECLDAVLAQASGTPEYEVTVIDNGSTDGSLELLQESYPQVHVEALPENTGFCHAVNVGLMPEARASLQRSIMLHVKYLRPVPERRFIGKAYWKRLAVLTSSILLTWRIWIWVIGPVFMAIAAITSRGRR